MAFGGITAYARRVRESRERRPVAPQRGVGGEPPPPGFIEECEKFRAARYEVWQRYRERCTGLVPWNLPGRSALPDIPLLGVAIDVASQFIPGAPTVLGALGLTGGGQVSNGWDPWVGAGGYGVGVCPPATRCLGVERLGICAGTCVPSAVGGPTPQLPFGEGNGNGAYYGNGQRNGAPTGMKICCPSGMHANTSAYFLKNGTRIEKGTKCVPNRTTNPLNPRAASRAGRRLRSAAKASKWLQKCKIPKR